MGIAIMKTITRAIPIARGNGEAVVGMAFCCGWPRLQIFCAAICSHEARSNDYKIWAETRSPELIIKWDQQIVKGEWRIHFE
jgi:hypothetical protein